MSRDDLSKLCLKASSKKRKSLLFQSSYHDICTDSRNDEVQDVPRLSIEKFIHQDQSPYRIRLPQQERKFPQKLLTWTSSLGSQDVHSQSPRENSTSKSWHLHGGRNDKVKNVSRLSEKFSSTKSNRIFRLPSQEVEWATKYPYLIELDWQGVNLKVTK